MKKLITFATAASLLMGSMAMPVYGAAFADIDTVTWSGFKPFLNQAAELGLMKGYDENGKKYCKPRNNVTYAEAVQLMYSIMRAYTGHDVSDATVTKWKPILSAYGVDTWAYHCSAYGLENGILSTSDLELVKNNKRQATREEVAMIFGKALDTVSGYDTKSNASLSYADKNTVSAAALPYVELLNRADLMVGDTDNKFNAKAKITRAEMAVLSVKTYTKLTNTAVETPSAATVAAGTVTTARVMQNGDLFLIVKTASGESLSLFGVKGKVSVKYDGEKIDFDDVGEGDTVKVTYEGTNLTAVEVTYSKAGLKADEETTEISGELVKLSNSKVTIEAGSREKEYRLDDKVKVKVDGEKSSVSDLEDAMEDADYDATLTLDEDEYVLEIEASMNKNNPTEGYVEDVDDDEIVIRAGSKEYTYKLSDDLEIEYDGKTVRFTKFEDEYDEYNYFVALKLDSKNKVEKITIESMEDEYNGTLTRITSKKVEFEAGGEKYEYDFADDVEVYIDGKKSSVSKLKESFDEDEKAYTVSVELDRDDEVEELRATPKFTENSDGELKKIDEDEIVVVVGKKEYTYDLAKEVEVRINDKKRDLDDLIDFAAEYTFEVELEFDKDGDVEQINVTLKEVEAGQLWDLVPEKNLLTVKAAGLSIDLTLAGSVDVTLEDDDVTLDELNDALDDAFGSQIYVELQYNSSGKVDEIKAIWQDVFGVLEEINEEDDEIIVEEDGDEEEYILARSTEFIYKLAASVDADEYKKNLNYDDDLDGLQDFLDDCDAERDTCEVILTLNKNGDVTRIIATAK